MASSSMSLTIGASCLHDEEYIKPPAHHPPDHSLHRLRSRFAPVAAEENAGRGKTRKPQLHKPQRTPRVSPPASQQERASKPRPGRAWLQTRIRLWCCCSSLSSLCSCCCSSLSSLSSCCSSCCCSLSSCCSKRLFERSKIYVMKSKYVMKISLLQFIEPTCLRTHAGDFDDAAPQ